jgi:hypothetical protein
VDDFTATLKARELVRRVRPVAAPVPVEVYAADVGAKIRVEDDMEPGEDGCLVEVGGKRFILVNAAASPSRQRFTVCHEIGHIVLGLASERNGAPPWSYARRSPNEVCCDVFAAELLLPHQLFKPRAEACSLGLLAIDELAAAFGASTTATGTRFAATVGTPCAFVVSEQGVVRYASRSVGLRAANAWIPVRAAVPDGSVSRKARLGGACDGPEEVEADVWFEDWNRGGTLFEEARHLGEWDQTLTLLWFEDEPPARAGGDSRADEEPGLKELDGILPWPGKKHRR